VANESDRKTYRFQIQGPNAVEILKIATADKIPAIPFFNIGELEIAGRTVQALNHGALAGA
jgi:vanillate/3-O-methylgallate O-demethylase